MIVALTNVEASIDIALLSGFHIPFESQFKADFYACATLIADPKVVHCLGVTLVSLLTIRVCLVTFFWHGYSPK